MVDVGDALALDNGRGAEPHWRVLTLFGAHIRRMVHPRHTAPTTARPVRPRRLFAGRQARARTKTRVSRRSMCLQCRVHIGIARTRSLMSLWQWDSEVDASAGAPVGMPCARAAETGSARGHVGHAFTRFGADAAAIVDNA